MRSRNSIRIIVRELEGVFDDADLAGRSGEDFDDIESERDVRHVEQVEPLHRAPDDQAALFLIDGIERSAEFLGRPGFHFDEDEFLSVAADEIDLAAVRGPEISPEDFVAAFAKVPGGDALAFAPEAEVRGLSPILKISHRSRMWHRLSSLCLSRFTGWKACATLQIPSFASYP